MVDGMTTSPQLVDMPIEPLELDEKIRVGMVAVDHTDAVVRIKRGDQPVAGFLDRLHVPRCDVASRPDQTKRVGSAVHSSRTRPKTCALLEIAFTKATAVRVTWI